MKKIIILVGIVIVLAAAGYYSFTQTKNKQIVLTPEEAKAKTEEFINANLMQPGSTATVKEITEEGGLYKMTIDIGSEQDIDSYLTKDGTKFFPQVMDIAEIEQQAADSPTDPAANQPPATTVSTQSDKPSVELFVMSHCPYGTQIEKGILPVLKTLGDKIDFELKFCDYAMHGKKELDEELRQYCIQKEQGDKLISYLECFLEAGDGDSCLTNVGINQSQLSSCVTATDTQYKVTELYNDQTSWKSGQFPQFNVNQADANKYGITGSPGLVVNGQKVQSGRSASALLSTICSAFSTQPAECSQTLDATTPSAGFGYAASAASSSGSCN